MHAHDGILEKRGFRVLGLGLWPKPYRHAHDLHLKARVKPQLLTNAVNRSYGLAR